MRQALISLLMQAISSMNDRYTRGRNNKWQQILRPVTNKRNNNFMTLLWVVGFGIVALTLVRNFNTTRIWNQISQPLKNMHINDKISQSLQSFGAVFNKRTLNGKTEQPQSSYYDGQAVHDTENAVEDSAIEKGV
ncbi:hypothetical protein [Ammoniphilus sp. 3BR4]|uniref:hypothetical protein n=1 Tax=Ammoniphilus sp. 3BR4 TaxID=3158265 RepID=UPI0034673D08